MCRKSRLIAMALALVMALGLISPVFAAEEDISAISSEGAAVTVLYTNDVHTYIDKDLTYSKVAAYRDTLSNVLLVDAGDHIQGTAYGSMDKGKTIIDIMNAVKYDAATLGNHEFDYGMEGAMNAIEWANFPFLSCNFYNEKDGVKGDSVLDAYKVFEVNGMKIAFVGITTPESFTKSTPAYFQDGNGNYIYGIAGGTDGADLYAAVQEAVDAASKEADIVIGLGHLGVDQASSPWTSKEVIANTTGLDAFIDGHSHTTMPMEEVKDKAGETVVLTQTGSYLNALGQMIITEDGEITTSLLTAEDLANVTPDADVKAIEDSWKTAVNDQLGQVIGTTSETLGNFMPDGTRLVRSVETNSGDIASDALYYLFDNKGLDVDAAIMNGGGIRNEAITGDISYLTCKNMHTFGNVACLITVKGQQIIDALEFGARGTGTGEEIGGFLQPSHLKYTVDVSVPSSVTMDDKGVFTGVAGDYRVKNVEIYDEASDSYVPLDPNAEYNLAGYNYTLRDLGDGFSMFQGSVNVLDYVMEDYQVLANYVQSFEKNEAGLPVVSGYADLYGDSRITLEYYDDAAVGYTKALASGYDAELEEGIQMASFLGLMYGTGNGAFTPDGQVTRSMLLTVCARIAGTENAEGAPWYAAGQTWAAANGIDAANLDEVITLQTAVDALKTAYGSTAEAGYSAEALAAPCTRAVLAQAAADIAITAPAPVQAEPEA